MPAMSENRRLYLDNAATSFPKPQRVHDAMLRYATEVGASPGRGSYAESVEGAAIIRRCRERIVELINGESPDHVVFGLNTTDALNLAIHGMVASRRRRKPGEPMHIVTTRMDHNSVLRPLSALAADGDVDCTYVDVDPVTGVVDSADIAAAVRTETLLVAVVHASNVTGTLQPIGAIGAVCREKGVPLLVDAAQSVGHVPVDVRAMHIDLLAFPGHKGLLGPLGTGALYMRPGMERVIEPVRHGGTGSVSEQDAQPETMPDRYESGSHNTVGIAGLSEGVAELLERGMDTVWAHERTLIRVMIDALADKALYPGLRLLGPQGVDDRVGVFSFTHEVLEPAELAAVLESEFSILTRAGIHCAPKAHEHFGTVDRGGAVRLSFGPDVTVADVHFAASALSQVCTAAVAT